MHTPEPWRITDTLGMFTSTENMYLVDGDFEHPTLIAVIPRHRFGSADRVPVNPDEWAANLRLLAAAPNLLEACAFGAGALRRLNDGASEDGDQKAVDVLHEAAALARGEG